MLDRGLRGSICRRENAPGVERLAPLLAEAGGVGGLAFVARKLPCVSWESHFVEAEPTTPSEVIQLLVDHLVVSEIFEGVCEGPSKRVEHEQHPVRAHDEGQLA